MFVLETSNFKEARITIFLISINALLYFFFSLAFEDLFYQLVQINSKIFVELEVWRLFTSMFLHGDVMHLFSNMIALLLFGTYIELNFSKFEFLLIYFISGLIGNMFSLYLLPFNVISLGASGAIFGLIGATLSLVIAERDTPLIMLGLFYVFYFLISSFSPGINYFAHIFGLLGGFSIGFAFKRKKKSFEPY
jgi:membrane associated rhomboid family serine protease